MVRIFLLCSQDTTAVARAAPSVGSVPAPSSSKRQRLLMSAFFNMDTMLVM